MGLPIFLPKCQLKLQFIDYAKFIFLSLGVQVRLDPEMYSGGTGQSDQFYDVSKNKIWPSD